ncbi:MAG TPA: hypothetical protein VHD62_00065 [Opitutaceae bacterium]|nr:hypothetical protein [Opitutaceae bacterium]
MLKEWETAGATYQSKVTFGRARSVAGCRVTSTFRTRIRAGVVLGVKFGVRKQFEAVHGEAQIRELRLRRFICAASLQPLGCAMEAFAQGAVFVRVAEFAQQSAHGVGASPALFDPTQSDGVGDAAGLRVLEQLALEGAALPRSRRVEPAGAICAQCRAGLGKAGDGRLAAGKGNGQPERLQFRGIVAALEFDEVEERAVAAESARAAELFA